MKTITLLASAGVLVAIPLFASAASRSTSLYAIISPPNGGSVVQIVTDTLNPYNNFVNVYWESQQQYCISNIPGPLPISASGGGPAGLNIMGTLVGSSFICFGSWEVSQISIDISIVPQTLYATNTNNTLVKGSSADPRTTHVSEWTSPYPGLTATGQVCFDAQCMPIDGWVGTYDLKHTTQ